MRGYSVGMTTPRKPTDRFQIAALVALPAEVVAPLEASPLGPFALHACADRDALLALLAGAGCDVLLVPGEGAVDAKQLLVDAAHDTAILIVAAAPTAQTVLDWLQRGAQDVLRPDELSAGVLALRVRAAIERKRLEHDARTAYATDVETGLPHQQQLIEHMSQLIALREREPAPMALLALRGAHPNPVDA